MSNATELTSAMAAVERRLKNTKDTAVITRGEFEAISRGLEDLIVFQETTLLNDLAQQASAVERGEIVDLPDSVQDSDGFIEWTRECSKVLNKCPGCGGVADNGHDRNFPEPNPYFCTKCDEGYK